MVASAGRIQRRVVAQNRGFQLLKRAAGFDPKLVDHRSPADPIALQSVRLAAHAVQREHQLAAEPLAHRVLAHQPLELGNELAVTTQG